MIVRRTALLLLCAVMLAACADAPPPRDDGPTDGTGGPSLDRPTEPDAVVLRVADEGGFVPVDWHLVQVPTFTLYGDGRVVVPGAQIAIYPAPALPAISERRIDEAAVQAVLRRALDAGLGARDLDLSDTGDVAIADAPTTVFTLTVAGRTTTARVYALGMAGAATPGMPADERALRDELAALAADLSDLSWAERDGATVGEERAYEAETARLLIGPIRRDPELPQERLAWPLGADLATLGEPLGWSDDTRCAVVAGEDWSALREAAQGANQLTPWTDGAAKRSITFRPLLPDETGC